MRHRVKTRKLSRKPQHRVAMKRNMAAAIIEHERIETTVTKAKAMRPMVEKLVTLAKEKNLHNFRRALALLGNNRQATTKLFDVLGPRFKDRPGGYTRILKQNKYRLGDNTQLALFEFVERSEKEVAELIAD
ncbi:MAG: 50S ribosomal protein L17 [Planctomycetes bacterium]|nr:50S ribosomal protein L17 [Planctomycetota bacterium]